MESQCSSTFFIKKSIDICLKIIQYNNLFQFEFCEIYCTKDKESMNRGMLLYAFLVFCTINFTKFKLIISVNSQKLISFKFI